MAMNVGQSINVVKSPTDDIRSHRLHDPRVDTLKDRILWILRHRGFAQRDLGTAADLAPSFISAYLQRAKSDPDASMSADNLSAIAKAAHVSLVWLSNGKGEPDDASLEQPHLKIAPSASPRWCDLPNWTDLLVEAMPLDPALKPWAWKHVAKEPTPEGAPRTAETVARMARAYADVVVQPVPPMPESPAFPAGQESTSGSREMPVTPKPPKQKRR
jgi:transcriptional regulator with XRE-family HTH domain